MSTNDNALTVLEHIEVIFDENHESFMRQANGKKLAQKFLSEVGWIFSSTDLTSIFKNLSTRNAFNDYAFIDGFGEGLLSANSEEQRERARMIFESIATHLNEYTKNQSEGLVFNDLYSLFWATEMFIFHTNGLLPVLSKLCKSDYSFTEEILEKLENPSILYSTFSYLNFKTDIDIFIELFKSFKSCEQDLEWNKSMVAPIALCYIVANIRANESYEDKLESFINALFERPDAVFLSIALGEYLIPNILNLNLRERELRHETVEDTIFNCMREHFNRSQNRDDLLSFLQKTYLIKEYKPRKEQFKETGLRENINSIASFNKLLAVFYLMPSLKDEDASLYIDAYEQQLCLNKITFFYNHQSELPPSALFVIGEAYFKQNFPIQSWLNGLNSFNESIHQDMRNPLKKQSHQNFQAIVFHLVVGLTLADWIHEKNRDSKSIEVLKKILNAVRILLFQKWHASSDEGLLLRISSLAIVRIFLFADEQEKSKECFNAIKQLSSSPKFVCGIVRFLLFNGATRELFEEPNFLDVVRQALEQRLEHLNNDAWRDQTAACEILEGVKKSIC